MGNFQMSKRSANQLFLFLLFLLFSTGLRAQDSNWSTIADNGWANNSVNTVVFRKNALTTFKEMQYAAYYDENQFVVLAKRKINAKTWKVLKTQYKGDANDAHKSISIIIDGKGYLHMAWGQHNNKLNYVKSVKPGSLILGEKEKMLGLKEDKISYPEFYKLANGNLLFCYRDGGSGNGNLMMNTYDCGTKVWKRIQDNLIDGEGKRNAYWQMAIDIKGAIHLSWVWRESPDVASNHDLCYAKSVDGGLTWQKTNAEKYQLPITAANAEYALKIPQKSELINQTSMSTDEQGNPFIATYWREQGALIPQYHIVYHKNSSWEVNNLAFRKTPFSLSGGGTKKIPIARPQLIIWQAGKQTATALLFRDAERGNKISIALNNDLSRLNWTIKDLTEENIGEWEPNYDLALWQAKKHLAIFVQKVEQVDGEGKANHSPTKVEVLTLKNLE